MVDRHMADELAVIGRRHALGRTRMGHDAIDLELLAALAAIGLADADDRAVAARVDDRAAHEHAVPAALGHSRDGSTPRKPGHRHQRNFCYNIPLPGW